MKVTTRHYGSNAFVNVVGDGYDASILIPDGMTASQALREQAQEMREKAERLRKRSVLMHLAADVYEGDR